MTIRLGVVMDPIGTINFKKDSTLAMLWAAQARGWQLCYLEQRDLYLRDGVPYGRWKPLRVHNDPEHALTDGAQSLTTQQFTDMMRSVKRVAAAVDREM